jgi:hypothetical protein
VSDKNHGESLIEKYAEKIGAYQGLAAEIAKDLPKHEKAAIGAALVHTPIAIAALVAIVCLAKVAAPWWAFLAALYVATLYAWLTCRKKNGETKAIESG